MHRKPSQFSLLARLVKPLLELMRAEGVDILEFEREVAVRINSNVNSGHHSNAWVEYLKLASEKTGNPGIALRYGEFIKFADLGPLGFAIASSKDIRAALSLLIRYHPIISLDLSWQLVSNNEGAALRIDASAGNTSGQAMFIDSVLSSVKYLSKLLIKDGPPPMSLSLSFSCPSYATDYRALFNGPVMFDAGICELVIPDHVLSLPLSRKAPDVQVLMTLKCEVIMEMLERSGLISTKVKWLLIQNSAALEIKRTAALLYMSERTLRRKLASEKTSFAEILKEVRNALAQEYLSKTDFSAAEIATLTGYSERASFNRAFKNWNNMSAGSYRSKCR